jgi:hypothetical protein
VTERAKPERRGRQQSSKSSRRNDIGQIAFGEVRFFEDRGPVAEGKGRRSIKVTCGDSQVVISKTNGLGHTLSWPKNIGGCTITLYCVESNGNTIDHTPIKLKPQAGLESYIAPIGTDMILMDCSGPSSDGTCELEMEE